MALSNKKNLLLGTVGVLIVLYAYFSLLIGPLEEEVVRLQQDLEKGRKQLVLLKTLKGEQERLSQIMTMARTRQTSLDASLLSNVEDIVKKLGLSDKAINMRPIPVTQTVSNATEEKLEIRFVTLGLLNILKFLDHIEALPTNVRIEKLDIRKTGTTATMTLVISSLLFRSGS